MEKAGFDITSVETDISSRESILNLIEECQKYGEVMSEAALDYLKELKNI